MLYILTDGLYRRHNLNKQAGFPPVQELAEWLRSWNHLGQAGEGCGLCLRQRECFPEPDDEVSVSV